MRIEERLDKLEEEIRDPNFRLNRGKANEVNYWIFDYPPQDELLVRDRIKYIKEKNDRGHDDYKIFEVDLYDFILDYLKEKGYLEKVYKFEERRGFEQINRAIGNLLKFNDKDSVIVEYIKENAPDNAIIFLTGIGKIYPVLRSHQDDNYYRAFKLVE